MSIFNKQVTVSYTAEQMYALVNDINAYSTQFDFEFTNKLLGNALNGLFAQLCDSMIDAFR